MFKYNLNAALAVTTLIAILLFFYSIGETATIFEESFEGSGYENTWYENTGSGSYLDANSSITDNPPPGSGNQCLKSVSGPSSHNAYTYHNFPNHNVTYGRVYLYVDSVNLANTQSKRIFRFAASDYQKCMFFYLYRNSSGQLQISVRFYENSSGDEEPEFNISLHRWYRFEWYYNRNSSVFQFKIDGVLRWNASLTRDHIPGKIILGFDDPSKARSGVVYFDLLKIVDDGWIGDETSTSTTTTIIDPIDVDGDGISNEEDNCPDSYNPNQEDTYPPHGNGLGDACDCEGNFDCDTDVGGEDCTTFLADLGRNLYFNPCADGNPCNGDFDCDGDVDATDSTKFLEDFGRNHYNNPCPACEVEDWCMY